MKNLKKFKNFVEGFYKLPIYIRGRTNTGKSMFLNTLL